MPEIDFPKLPNARWFIGGCVERGDGSSFRKSAHAHTRKDDEFFEWICVRSRKPETLLLPDGEPTNLAKHEYAHVLTGEGHTDRFWRVLARIGGYMERASYFGHEREKYPAMRSKWKDVKVQVLTGCGVEFFDR